MTFPFDEEIILENSFALLKPFQKSDAHNLLSIAVGEKGLLQFSPMPVYTKELLSRYIEKTIYDRQNKPRYLYSIFNKTKNTYAGSISIMNIFNTDGRLEIGSTRMCKMFQKTGLNKICNYLMLRLAFADLNTERVEFKTGERNLISRKAIEKIGDNLKVF